MTVTLGIFACLYAAACVSEGFLHPRSHLAFSVGLLAIEVSATSVAVRTPGAAQSEQHSLFLFRPIFRIHIGLITRIVSDII